MNQLSAPAGLQAPHRIGFSVPPVVARWRSLRLVERNALAYRRIWVVFVAGLAEPVLYLLSIGVGVGGLVGDLPGPGGRPVPYDVYVAPGLMAAAAMNGAVFDTTFNFFVQWKYLGRYEAVLATPLGVRDVAAGEVAWALIRGTIYAAAFLIAMVALGLARSAWVVAALPATVLIALAFAGMGLAAATFMRSFVDFDYVNLAIVPLFLFSATFFPLDRYPGPLAAVVQATPLYQGVALIRTLSLGLLGWELVGHAAYLGVLGLAGTAVAARRLGQLIQP